MTKARLFTVLATMMLCSVSVWYGARVYAVKQLELEAATLRHKQVVIVNGVKMGDRSAAYFGAFHGLPVVMQAIADAHPLFAVAFVSFPFGCMGRRIHAYFLRKTVKRPLPDMILSGGVAAICVFVALLLRQGLLSSPLLPPYPGLVVVSLVAGAFAEASWKWIRLSGWS